MESSGPSDDHAYKLWMQCTDEQIETKYDCEQCSGVVKCYERMQIYEVILDEIIEGCCHAVFTFCLIKYPQRSLR